MICRRPAAAAALCLLIFQPLAIFQASMQLSFGAVLGISLVGDIFKKILMPSSDKTTVRINRFCSVMGLSIAMLPVLLYHYYQYPLYAILLNQLVIPFAGIFTCITGRGTLYFLYLHRLLVLYA